MFSRYNQAQTLWIGLSFLAVGLMMGLMFFGGNELLDDQNAGGRSEPIIDIDTLEVVDVSLDDDAVLGDPNAPVTMIEFSDFQCYYCESWHSETYPLIKEKYIDTGLVKLVVRDFINGKHPQSSPAAQAAECVGESGGDEAYYAMYDTLFATSSEWSGSEEATELFIGYASELGHDIRSCLENGDMLDETNADYTASRGYGVSGTPTFFINGKKLVGAWPYEVFEAIIEAQL